MSYKPDETDLRYLFYALKRSNLEKLTITTAIPGVNRDSLYGKKIPLPPLEEQKRIAAILDKADAIRRKRKEAIRLTEELLRSTFLDMFGDPVTNPKGWKVESLENISIVQSGIAKGKKVNPSEAISMPYIRVANVQDGYLNLDEIKEEIQQWIT
ncbi:MAG: restriction endonuclease subunit S [Cyanobacteria bacterium P01_G01_bin.49]